MPLIALLVAGCSSFPSSMNPVSWWHDMQGGKIAEERPPPPGANQPYPNLASVPPAPEQPDRAALANIANALISDRTNAQHIAAAAPIADPSLPSASPGLFGRGTVPPPPPPPPPGSVAASATVPAAEAPPAPKQPAAEAEVAPPPTKAPVGAVQSTPLAPPGAAAQPPPVEAAAPPPLPAAPPPPPSLPGVATAAPSPPASPPPPATVPPAPSIAAPAVSPATAAAPAPLPAAPPPSPPAPAVAPPPVAPATVASATPVPPPSPKPADSVSVTFITGSAVLPPSAASTLQQLAARRGNGIIAVTGYGDAASDNPDAQSAALSLGLSRAQAMAAALTSAGVPPSAVQVDAAAIGRGGTARLVQ